MAFNNRNLVGREVVKFINELVDFVLKLTCVSLVIVELSNEDLVNTIENASLL